jgi:hypothetical protein
MRRKRDSLANSYETLDSFTHNYCKVMANQFHLDWVDRYQQTPNQKTRILAGIALGNDTEQRTGLIEYEAQVFRDFYCHLDQFHARAIDRGIVRNTARDNTYREQHMLLKTLLHQETKMSLFYLSEIARTQQIAERRGIKSPLKRLLHIIQTTPNSFASTYASQYDCPQTAIYDHHAERAIELFDNEIARSPNTPSDTFDMSQLAATMSRQMRSDEVMILQQANVSAHQKA